MLLESLLCSWRLSALSSLSDLRADTAFMGDPAYRTYITPTTHADRAAR
jgi:hypothetical protein